MSDQHPTPDPERRDPAPAEPNDSSYTPPQYGEGSTAYGQQSYEAPRYDQQPPQAQQGGYAPPNYGEQGQQYQAQQYQAPQYDQPQYGQQQYGQQQGYPQQPYGQPQYDQQAHGQQPYPAQPYQQQYPSGYQQQWPTEQAPQSNTLGLIGFGIVAVCTVVLAVVGWIIGGAFGQFMLDYGIDPTQNPDPSDPMLIAFSQQLQGPFMVGFLATIGGIAGWIVSIIATTRRRGRTFGIWGIILGILAPVIGFIAMFLAMMPAAQQIAG